MIMKSDIKRKDLKNNFLKNIIVRFDYTGIAEVELDRIIAKVKSIFKADGYNKLKEEYLTEMDFQLQDPESIEMDALPIKEIRKKRAYVFVNDEKGIECKLSTQFAFVSIQSQKYISFVEYSGTLLRVINILREEVEFLNCVRFGIRKVNQCIMKDIYSLNKYFDTKFFKMYGLDKRHVPKLFESKDCFVDGKYNINLIRMVVMGEYDDEAACQVILDSELYITKMKDINELFNGNTEITAMNEKLFELYKEALTEAFIEELGKEDYSDSNIIGVERNE